MTTQIKAIAFDHSVLFMSSGQALEANSATHIKMKELLQWLKSKGIKIAIFANFPRNISNNLRHFDYPEFDLVVSATSVGKFKGSPHWITHTCDRFEVRPNEMIYVGDQKHDHITASNGGTFYITALWSLSETAQAAFANNALATKTPWELMVLLSHFFLRSPQYTVRYDSELVYRVLLPRPDDCTSAGLPDPVKALKETPNHRVGFMTSSTFYLWHLMANLYLEGFFDHPTGLLVYPSSNPKSKHSAISPFLPRCSSLPQCRELSDLLIRWRQATDTSLARSKKQPVSPSIQTDTVHLGKKIGGIRHFLILDDFSTKGFSMSWAYTLLRSAGATRIIFAAVSKYPPYNSGTLHLPKSLDAINPLAKESYSPDLFQDTQISFQHNPSTTSSIAHSYNALKLNRLID